jgi:hypothetical protein
VTLHDANRHSRLTYRQLIAEIQDKEGVPEELVLLLMFLVAELELLDSRVPSPEYLGAALDAHDRIDKRKVRPK